jgi:hypothetical protein
MVRYHFHATDGYAAVFDTHGLQLDREDVEDAAGYAAHYVRRHFGGGADLSDWIIAVHDEVGDAIVTLPFVDLPEIVTQDLAAR